MPGTCIAASDSLYASPLTKMANQSTFSADEELAGIIERELLARKITAPLRMPDFAARLAAGHITAEDWTALMEAESISDTPSASTPE